MDLEGILYEPSNPPEEVRYSALEFDGDRTIGGVAMRYGDVATMPWGDEERVEPGAFGEVTRADVILNLMHQRERPVARTGGGGLDLTNDHHALRASASLANTQDGNDVLTLVGKKILRGLSVQMVVHRYRIIGNVRVIERAKLTGLGIVDSPAYPESVINRQKEIVAGREPPVEGLTEEQVRAIVAEGIKSAGEGADPEAITAAVSTGLAATITGEAERAADERVASALAERDEAEAARVAAEEEKRAAEVKVTEDRASIEAAAQDRAELIVEVRALLPDAYEAKGKTVKEILVAAAGTEVEDAENRSEDYLRAKVEGINERRAEAAKRGGGSGGGGGGGAPAPPARPNMMRMIEQKRMKEREAARTAA